MLQIYLYLFITGAISSGKFYFYFLRSNLKQYNFFPHKFYTKHKKLSYSQRLTSQFSFSPQKIFAIYIKM